MKKQTPKIGIDIGRVIIGPVIGGRADTSFIGNSLEKAVLTPPSPGAIEGVSTLVKQFEGNAWLVSKCGHSVQRKTRAWLRHHDFHTRTGLNHNAVRFCLMRPDKAIHCRQLKLTHFIDDRIDVLEHLRGQVNHLFLFGEQPRLKKTPGWVCHVINWDETVEQVQASIRSEADASV